MALAVMRRDATGDIDARLGEFGPDHALTRRQLEVLSHMRGVTRTKQSHVSTLGTVEEPVAYLLRKDGHRFARRARRPTLDALSDIAMRTSLSRRDLLRVRRMREILDVYRPGARPVADEVQEELRAAVDGDMSLAMRPVLGELGWSFDFLYTAIDTSYLRALVSRFDGTPWCSYFPVTPEDLRNRALRPKVIHAHLIANPPTPQYRALVEAMEQTPGYGAKRDDLGVSLCDGEVTLGWFAVARMAPFGPRELALLDAIIPRLRMRMLLEHQIGRPTAAQVLLESALEEIPTAAFILAGTTIAHANATGRLLLDRDRRSVVEKLRESLRPGRAVTPFAITSVESPGCSPTSLAVMRVDGTGDIDKRLTSFAAEHALTNRQLEVLSLIARGYGNKIIAEHMSVAVGTIEEHVAHLLRKTGTDSRCALVARLFTR